MLKLLLLCFRCCSVKVGETLKVDPNVFEACIHLSQVRVRVFFVVLFYSILFHDCVVGLLNFLFVIV
jgi:hypothetical protein